MKEQERIETTSNITIEVKSQNYNCKGELIDAITAGSKLTKADAGRLEFVDEDSLTFKSSNCGRSKIEVDHNSSSTDILSDDDAIKSRTLEVDVKSQILNAEKGELVDAIAAGAKLTKADAGRFTGQKSEEWLNLKVEGATDDECAKTEMRSHSKLTKADAGKA